MKIGDQVYYVAIERAVRMLSNETFVICSGAIDKIVESRKGKTYVVGNDRELPPEQLFKTQAKAEDYAETLFQELVAKLRPVLIKYRESR